MENIRYMTAEDTECVFNMMREFYNSPALITTPSDEILKKNISDCISDLPFIEGYIFEDSTKMLGYAMIAKSYSTEFGGMCIWIEDIYLLPEYRHKGIATRFFKYIEKTYSKTAVVMRLEAEKDNIKAVSAYRKNGFFELPYMELVKEL